MLAPRQVIAAFRLEVDDPLIPGLDEGEVPDEDSLWKENELLGYLDEAQAEVARITFALSARAALEVTGGDPYVELPADYQEPRRARMIESRTTLRIRNTDELSMEVVNDYGVQGLGDWESYEGRPTIAVFDDRDGYLRLVGIPPTDDTLELLYYRRPRPLERMSSELELRDRKFKRAFLHWMKHLAYRKQDADALDLQRADMFEVEFGKEMARLYGEIRRGKRRAGTVRYGGL